MKFKKGDKVKIKDEYKHYKDFCKISEVIGTITKIKEVYNFIYVDFGLKTKGGNSLAHIYNESVLEIVDLNSVHNQVH